jgi:uncharacterized protein
MATIDHEILVRLEKAAAERCSNHEPAHDYLHVQRVVSSARHIALAEHADAFVVTAAALLHELFNYPKGHPDSPRSGDVCAEHAAVVLRDAGCASSRIEPIVYAIRVHSFSRGIVPDTLEGRVLQDADRVDAIGAIGIARCFATCAAMERPFYEASDPFCRQRAPNDKDFGVDHFYKKLLVIPDTLHTETAKGLAAPRMRFMREYLEQLGREIAEVS